MKDQPKKKDHMSAVADSLFVLAGIIGTFVAVVCWQGIRHVKFKKPETWIFAVSLLSCSYLCIHFDYIHLQVLHFLIPWVFTTEFLESFITHVSDGFHFFMIGILPLIGILFAMGLKDYLQRNKYQNALNRIGLKNAVGETPQVTIVYPTTEFAKVVKIKSMGIGIDQYKNKHADLEAAFGETIHEIKVSNGDRRVIEIGMTEKFLPDLLRYSDCVDALKSPYSIIIGESLHGIITQCFLTFPHLLISGASGGGKTYFFNQVIISLNRSSKHLQFYLLDLKRGTGTAEVKLLPNVRVAKDETEALAYLRLVHKEMMKRFEYLEAKKRKVIDPVRDRKDVIFVGVDEASVLYTKDTLDKERNEIIKEARALTEDIAKLGRSAGCHLILATQKVTNDTIDTRIQENVGGKISFKAETLQGSNTVLGNKQAFELSKVKGRAIWAYGSDFTEVQTPYLSDAELEVEVKMLTDKMKKDENFLFQSVFDLNPKSDPRAEEFTQAA